MKLFKIIFFHLYAFYESTESPPQLKPYILISITTSFWLSSIVHLLFYFSGAILLPIYVFLMNMFIPFIIFYFTFLFKSKYAVIYTEIQYSKFNIPEYKWLTWSYIILAVPTMSIILMNYRLPLG
jgi:hypothetical protein